MSTQNSTKPKGNATPESCDHATKLTGQCVKCGTYPYDQIEVARSVPVVIAKNPKAYLAQQWEATQ